MTRDAMFERYTEQAKRTLFFSRYEASLLGSVSIETEHILLGLIREGKGPTYHILARSHRALENVRKDIERRTVFREKLPTSVEIPFSAETKRVLQFAASESDALDHTHIGTEHLLLGLLREESSLAASILRENGFALGALRDEVSALPKPTPHAAPFNPAQVAEELDQVKALVDRLASHLPDSHAATPIVEQIRLNLERLQERFRR
jgi:ATP-dependent Clp protease ATP-binding subunit ClpC